MPKKRKAAGSAGEKPLKKTKTGSPPPSEKPAAKKAVVQQQQRDPYKALLMQIHPSLRFMPSSRKLVSDLVAAVGQVLMHSRGGELRKCRTVAAVKAALACPAFTKPAGDLRPSESTHSILVAQKHRSTEAQRRAAVPAR